MVRRVVAFLAIAVGIAAAQGAPTLTQNFRPGDKVRFLVRFDGKPELTRMNVGFGIQGNPNKDQAGFAANVTLTELKQLSTGEFEVSGTIPNNTATGTYQLTQIDAFHDAAARAYRGGELPTVTINVVNDVGYNFPPLKSVTEVK